MKMIGTSALCLRHRPARTQRSRLDSASMGGIVFADLNVAARKLAEIANGIEAVQDGRIFIGFRSSMD
jgi:hypothetical protein